MQNKAATKPLSTRQLDAMDAAAAEVAEILRALSNETRLRILCELAQGELSVGELNGRVPLSQSALSQHLARLRDENLVATRREAQTIFYRIGDRRVTALMAALHEIYCRPGKG